MNVDLNKQDLINLLRSVKPDTWVTWYEDNDLSGKEEIFVSCSDKKLSNSLAKLLIKLLEEKHIEL